MDNDFWGGLSEMFSNFANSGGFGAIAQAALPSLAGAVGAGLVNHFLPGTDDKQKGMDTRTGTQQQAEGLRRQGAQGAGKGYQLALQGQLDPREEYLVRKRSRSADAAAGTLETGGHVTRENNAVRDQVLANRQMFGNQLQGMTTGYQHLTPYTQKGKPNMWAQALTGAVGRGLERGLSASWGKWNNPVQQSDGFAQLRGNSSSLSDYLRSTT